MSGNVWEWCEDTCTEELDAIPNTGLPYVGPGDEKTSARAAATTTGTCIAEVWWRYGIEPGRSDGLHMVSALCSARNEPAVQEVRKRHKRLTSTPRNTQMQSAKFCKSTHTADAGVSGFVTFAEIVHHLMAVVWGGTGMK
jgi:hypothetical protein